MQNAPIQSTRAVADSQVEPEPSPCSAVPEPSDMGVSTDVDAFISHLDRKYADRIKTRPLAFKKRLLRLISAKLPPYPKRSGRPRLPRITLAVEMMYQEQTKRLGQARKAAVNCAPIALQCIPGFHKFRSQYRRRAEIERLRNAVYARLKRIRARKSFPIPQA